MKLLLSLALGAMAAFTVALAQTSGVALAAANCDAIGYDGRDGKNNYVIKGNTATIKFKVTGNKDCKLPVTILSWKAPSANGAPFDKQVLFLKKTQVFTPGQNRTLSIQIPDCFYQVDTVTGTGIYGRTGEAHLYGSRMIGYKLGGTKNCNPPKVTPPKVVVKNIKVCDLATKRIITINEKAFDARKHSKDLNSPACKPVVPGKVLVCDEATGDIIEVNEADKDKYLPVDDVACNPVTEVEVPETPEVKGEETPEVKGEEAPEEIASTGPEALLGGLFGTSAVGYSAYSYFQSRRDLVSKFLKR